MDIHDILTKHKLWLGGEDGGERANLSNADLSDANLASANLRGANLSNADLSDANLASAKLRGADLTGANLSDANLRDTNFIGADLTGANFIGADLTGADLSDANLRDTSFIGADLTGADLSGADLTGADLAGADLRYADLTGADLTGADLRYADLGEAALTGAADLGKAKGPPSWPAGIGTSHVLEINTSDGNVQETEPSLSRRKDVLQQAEKCITQDRAATHGDAEDSFSSIAALWEWWMIHRDGGPLTAYDVAMMMSLFKHARAASNKKHDDNFVDAIGYLALASEMTNG